MGNGNDTQEDPMPITQDAPPVITTLFRSALDQRGAQRVDFTISTVAHLDDEHAQCDHCAEHSMITMQGYFREFRGGEDVMHSTCAPCLVRIIAADADADVTVRIEVAR